jgi:hypothetical protein
VEAAGIEPTTIFSGNTTLPTPGGADSGAVASTDPLSAFVASLTPDQKAKLAALLLGKRPS